MMLSFDFRGTKCIIDDDYNIKSEGTLADKIRTIWDSILSDVRPYSPCPIDEMHAFFEDLGADIAHYDIEAVEGMVY